MVNNIKQLNEKFDIVKEQGWIIGNKKNTGSVGLLFEQLIGKKWEKSEFPDFNGIEIKVKSNSPEKYIALFHGAPDSAPLEIDRLKNTYGYSDKEFKQAKVFNFSVYSNYKKKICNGYKFSLYVNYKLEKVELIIYDKNNNIVDDKTSWSFHLLKEKLYRKLSYLAFIEAESKYEYGNKYHKYNKISFYKLKGFEQFIKLIDSGKIRISFSVGIRRSGEFAGEKYDHGTAFSIKRYHLHHLFDKI